MSLSGCFWGEKVEVPPASVGMVLGKNGYQSDIVPPSRFRLAKYGHLSHVVEAGDLGDASQEYVQRLVEHFT